MPSGETRILEWTEPLFAVYGDEDGRDALPPSRDIYYAWRPDEPNPWLLHYCKLTGADVEPDHAERWVWAGTSAHTLVSRSPLHLEPSIGWQACCGRHGFIRNGLWVPVGDGGWMPT